MSLKVHFLNVGKGNCTIIEFPSRRLSVIDIDDSRLSDDEKEIMETKYKISLTDPISYISAEFPGREIFRFILTHPDMDHMSGLYRLIKEQGIKVLNFWDTEHNKKIDPSTWDNSPYSKDDWDIYLQIRESKENPKALRLYRDETSDCCWIQDNMKIFSPSKELEKSANLTKEYDHLSYVHLIEYKGRKILLGGDATKEAWEEILNHYGEEGLKADVLLAPHHGSPNNVHDDALKAVNPFITIISVGVGIDYDYEFYSKISRQEVFSTKYYGNIFIQINEDGSIYYSTEHKR